jgi:hypothetical protein
MLFLLICALILSWPLVNALALEPREDDLVPIEPCSPTLSITT